MNEISLQVIARIRNDFPTKFGLPRQSGMIGTLESSVVFEPDFRNPDLLRGLEGYTHLWLIWGFSKNQRADWSPTVRPPRLGGNTRMGVFATRSPFRPNPLGLSCVELKAVNLDTPSSPTLTVVGADLMDNTPIYDIKPYLPYADSLPHAQGGFAHDAPGTALTVDFPARWLTMIPPEKQATLMAVLSGDPRPAYQNDPDRIYGFGYGGFDVRFQVDGEHLTVTEIIKL